MKRLGWYLGLVAGTARTTVAVYAADQNLTFAQATEQAAQINRTIATLTERAEKAEREREQLRGKYTTIIAETSETLQLAYQVYRDAGGKVNGNSIYSLGEWLQWLPTQTDEHFRA